ncbi:ComJ Protein involved in catabolism of external DNA [Burkholderiaceae bacterium]|jgi:23S rRNA (adenine2030-N6)-methyltransferase
MFSYRHAFHAGGHADMLKHLVLIELIHYLQEKPGAITFIDTHAGAGIYKLQDGFSQVSKEAQLGIERLAAKVMPAFENLLQQVQFENQTEQLSIYPGSPFILARLLRPQDRLKLFELHPKEILILQGNVAQLPNAQQIDVYTSNGFSGLKALLPPLGRRGLILIDPAYEDKNDYRLLETTLAEGLQRFATGCFALWYPILPRRESIALVDRLKKVLANYSRPWLQAELRVANVPGERRLQASGMLIVNPPWTLKEKLALALPELKTALAQDSKASFHLSSAEV